MCMYIRSRGSACWRNDETSGVVSYFVCFFT